MWLKERVFYEIYVPSFADGNDDGIGDFTGIIEKLDYLQQLGVKGIWLTPFYVSPKIDNGYDISDYYSIDPSYGTMEQFKLFLDEAHDRDIKVVIDLVLNHTSNLHPWFLDSQKSITSKYRDFYIWKKQIPNNWESFFLGSAWEYCNNTQQYYYHGFSKEQVCLNWSNDVVKVEMKKVMKFWLDLGVDGFRLDVINFLKVNDECFLKDNPYDEEGKQIHLYDQNQPGIIETIKELVSYVKSWEDKVLIGEVGSEELEILNQYVGSELLDVVFNFNLGSIDKLDINCIYNNLVQMEALKMLPTLFFGSHDMGRWFSRLCDENFDLAKVVAALTMFGYGVPFVYQGDEQGLVDFYAENVDELNDIQGKLHFKQCISRGDSEEIALKKANEISRDKSRKLISWKDNEIKNNNNFHEFYKKIINIRNCNPILQYGTYKSIDCVGDIIVFSREYNGEKINVILNFSEYKIQYKKQGSRFLYCNTEESFTEIQGYEVTLIFDE